jgi:hypothetical protein
VIRFQRAQELLAVWQSVQHQGWQYIVRLDKSSFYWNIDWEQQWLPADDEPGSRRRRGINHEITMLTAVCNTRGFHLIDTMPRGEKFSARYFIDKILRPICAQLIQIERSKLVTHADNSRCYNAKWCLTSCYKNKRNLPLIPRMSQISHPRTFSFLVF